MKIYLYALNTLADWEVAYLTAELNTGRFRDKTKKNVAFVIIGNTMEPVKTMGGMTVYPDADLGDVVFEEGDLLILPGADTWSDDSNKRILDRIPALLAGNVVIAAICGATAALAKIGLLNCRNHTSNDREFLKMTGPEYSGEDYYLYQPAVADGNLITASGLAPLEFSYEVLKKADVMRRDTLEAWYQLYTTREAPFFFALMASLEG